MGLLTVVFTILKLTGQIAWSWWWVAAPLWAPLAFLGIAFLVMFVFYLFVEVNSYIAERKATEEKPEE